MKLAAVLPLLVLLACEEPPPPKAPHPHGHASPPEPKGTEAKLAEVARVHGGTGPWAVSGYRMGEYALKNLELTRGSFDLEVVHFTPKEVQYACIADGASAATGASMGKLNLSLETAPASDTRTTYRNRKSGRALTLRVAPAFVKRFLDVPREQLGVAGKEAIQLPDREIFEAVPQPNDKVPFFGLDGEFTSDQPAAPKCTADYAPRGRNPGLVRFTKGEGMSFYEDRNGERPIAEDCRYKFRGHVPDPKYFGIEKEQSPTSLWLEYELTGGPPACEETYPFVIVRPPEGADAKRHLHLRYGTRGTTLEALVALSAAPPAGACDPWWSVYCTRGRKDCDDD